MRIPTRKCNPLWFYTPQTMRILAETMRNLKNSDTTHKPTIETRERKSMNSPRSTADREGGLEFDQ
jgi:hypothetical protein